MKTNMLNMKKGSQLQPAAHSCSDCRLSWLWEQLSDGQNSFQKYFENRK